MEETDPNHDWRQQMTGLIEIYEAYYEKSAEVRRKAPPLA